MWEEPEGVVHASAEDGDLPLKEKDRAKSNGQSPTMLLKDPKRLTKRGGGRKKGLLFGEAGPSRNRHGPASHESDLRLRVTLSSDSQPKRHLARGEKV